MKHILALSIIVYFVGFAPMFPASLVTSNSDVALASPYSSGDLFSQEQLENLLAPIALYPDPLLAQVLVAATFPDQIDEAARFLRANADPKAIDYQPWDVSVKAVAHYPTVLYMMADDLDWTATLGQAYVSQSTAVMTAVQRLRGYARASGSLVSTAQMEVVYRGGYISLWPVHPRYLYVPVYDPARVYFHRGSYRPRSLISFSIGFAIGSWLNYDCDWYGHRVYYHGWVPRSGWIHRYRPHIHRNRAYVNSRHRDVVVNRPVLNRWVNHKRLDRHKAVHRRVHYNKARVNRAPGEHRVDRRERVRSSEGYYKTSKKRKVIDRHVHYRKGRANQQSADHRVNRRSVDNNRRDYRQGVRRDVDRNHRRIEANRDRSKRSRSEKIGRNRSIQTERIKERRGFRAKRVEAAKVRPRGERGDRTVYREGRTSRDARAGSWQGRSGRSQIKERVAAQGSSGRSGFASAGRWNQGRGPGGRGR
ncbi:MAG: DUF3300 domain-containing protein [bacterium]|nr:DUF3300 domain-containing protein [bacterium]